MATGSGMEGGRVGKMVVSGLLSRNTMDFAPGTCSMQEGVQILAAKKLENYSRSR